MNELGERCGRGGAPTTGPGPQTGYRREVGQQQALPTTGRGTIHRRAADDQLKNHVSRRIMALLRAWRASCILTTLQPGPGWNHLHAASLSQAWLPGLGACSASGYSSTHWLELPGAQHNSGGARTTSVRGVRAFAAAAAATRDKSRPHLQPVRSRVPGVLRLDPAARLHACLGPRECTPPRGCWLLAAGCSSPKL